MSNGKARRARIRRKSTRPLILPPSDPPPVECWNCGARNSPYRAGLLYIECWRCGRSIEL